MDSSLTNLLASADRGDAPAAKAALYDELHRMLALLLASSVGDAVNAELGRTQIRLPTF